MKKYIVVPLFMLILLFLKGCSTNEDIAKLYKQETPLEVDIFTPETYSPNTPSTIKAVLNQNGTLVDNADFVHFTIWNQEGSVQHPMQEAKAEGNGQYSISKNLEFEGLYFVQVHASSKGSVIMPQKQFIVGNLTESDIEFLKNKAPIEPKNQEKHH